MSSTEQDVALPAAAVLERRSSRTTQEKRKQPCGEKYERSLRPLTLPPQKSQTPFDGAASLVVERAAGTGF